VQFSFGIHAYSMALSWRSMSESTGRNDLVLGSNDSVPWTFIPGASSQLVSRMRSIRPINWVVIQATIVLSVPLDQLIECRRLLEATMP
jgi:hypothetical protein